MTGANKKRWILPLVIAVIVIAAALAIIVPSAVRRARVKDSVAKQNYVAAKLIELGSFDDAQSLALGTDALLPNDISKELVVLSSGFMCDFDSGIYQAEKFGSGKNDEIISSLCEIYSEYANDPEIYVDRYDGLYHPDDQMYEELQSKLLDHLSTIQKKIKLKKTGSELQSMLELYSGNYSAYNELEGSTSPAALRLRTLYAVENLGAEEALSDIDALVSSDDSFPNRALAANIIATRITADYLSTNDDEQKLIGKFDDLSDLYNKIETELSKVNADYSDIDYLRNENKKIGNLADRIDSLTKEIETEPIKRAINYIESTTPAADKNTAAYEVERSFLYYLNGEEDTAKKLLTLMFAKLEKKSKTTDSVSATMSQLSDWYRENNDTSSGHTILRSKWDSVSKLLGIPTTSFNNAEEFFRLIIEALDTMHRSLLIRDIDPSDFPTVRVTLNAADEVKKYLKKSNLKITDTDGKVKDVKITSLSKGKMKQDVSVMLVVDTSGSMGGTPLEDTKDAVRKFVNNASADVRIGLTGFNHIASLICAPEISRRGLLIELDKLEADGGTDISNALSTASEGISRMSGRKIIILLSDGADGSVDRIDQVLQSVNIAGITVYTIGFGGADSDYLTKIATSCGGKYYEAYSSDLLSEVYDAIGSSMANDYILEYLVTENPEEYDRNFNVTLKKSNTAARKNYRVGIGADEIDDDQSRSYGAFRQIITRSK